MALTKYEQETIIIYNQEEDTAIIDTCDKVLISKLEDMRKKSLNIVMQKKSESCRQYICPKGWIKVQMPRQYSEKIRAKMAKRMEHVRAAKQAGEKYGK